MFMATATPETEPHELMHEKAARELDVMEELLEESALFLAPCTISELRESVREQREQERISSEIGNIAVWNLINREKLVLENDLSAIKLGEELQIIADTRNNIEHLI